MKNFAKRSKRRIIHHLILIFISSAAILIIFSLLQAKDIKFRLSLATGYVGLALLSATLVTGAINILRRRRNPVSTDLRRDVGIWCGIISLLHVIIGLQVHMGNMLLYFLRETSGKFYVPRTDLFGFANYAGLIGAGIIFLLLALSNDFSLRRLGKVRWKFFQQWNYALILLVILHSIAYQIIEKRQLPFLMLFVFIIGFTFIVQISGFLRVKRKNSALNEKN